MSSPWVHSDMILGNCPGRGCRPGAAAAVRLESPLRPGDGRRAAARAPHTPHSEVVLSIISRIRRMGRFGVITAAMALAFGAGLALAPGVQAADLDTPSTATPPPAPAAPSPSGGWLDVSTWPLIPVPEIGVDPDSGVTLGVLPVWLHTNDQHEITRIFAPDLIYN